MTISEIKQHLRLSQVLEYYNLQPRNNMLLCPFHQDKNASLQVNLEKDFYKCHGCGKTGDVIEWVQEYEKITKHQAILKCKELLGIMNDKLKIMNVSTTQNQKNTMNKEERTAFLESMFTRFRKGIFNSIPAKEYSEGRCLDYKNLEIGYNGGQFHHGSRRDEHLIATCLKYGLLSETGKQGYNVFGKSCICFPLRNKENQIVSLYFRSIITPSLGGVKGEVAKHFYLKNRQGIYPNYPNVNTKKLILTEAIIDAASFLCHPELVEGYSILACYGTNGLNDEILNAIKDLKQLEEIIFAFDNDTAGRTATANYSKMLIEELPGIKISVLEPINKDINETLQAHEESIFIKLLSNRKSFSFSNEISTEKEKIISSGGSPLDFLKRSHLIENLNGFIGKAGIVGEENSRMLLFLIIISYLNKNPLHALVQGSSGSGKTHIISRIADLMPQEDVLRFTRITESSLYNWGEFDLHGKVIIIEDLDGLKEDALYALREFISNQVLRSSVTIKDKKGNNKSSHKIVKGQFSSLSATTKGETYEDNMSRSFLLAVDESKEQTARIIEYQNQRIAGEINPKEQEKAIHFIQQMVRNLKVYEVINPYATQLHLPEKVHKIRRLNEMYQAVIKQVTFLNQYQRKLTNNNQLITEIEDIEQATEILFESIVLKVDELDGSLRQFFEKLKKYLKNKDQEFTQREIRQELNVSKAQCSRYINTLLELEYITSKFSGNLKRVNYKIDYWDNHQKLRAEIKDFLMNQIQRIKNEK